MYNQDNVKLDNLTFFNQNVLWPHSMVFLKAVLCNILGRKNEPNLIKNGILFPKLFLPTVRKNCSSDREKLLKFEA